MKGSKNKKAINAEITRNLSANGSKNFPVSVSCFSLRAVHPSNKSVNEAMTNITSAHILCSMVGVKIKYKNSGIRIIRDNVNKFGIFK